MYNIYVDTDGDAKPEVTFQFRFYWRLQNPNTFLYNTGPITHLNDPNWNRQMHYAVYMVDKRGKTTTLAKDLLCPPCNIGPRSTPDYEALAAAAVHSLHGGIKVFAGQRREGFYVDLGAIFDLAALRPFQSLHRFPPKENMPGVDSTSMVNVHTIAIQVPKKLLTRDHSNPTHVQDPRSVIGAWAGADRRKATVRNADGTWSHAGPFMQVSRLGNPLINEVVIPMSKKDYWNFQPPFKDKQFLNYYQKPEVGGLLPFLYPNVFPKLAAYTKPRVDLVYVLLKGIPKTVLPTAPTFTGDIPADMLRLNMAVKPTTHNPSAYGVLGGDLAGFPNGRRVFDDTVTIELRAIAGLTIPLVDPSYTPDGAAGLIFDVSPPPADRYISHFPYLGTPLSGYDVPKAA
jgi:hypothetical protein